VGALSCDFVLNARICFRERQDLRLIGDFGFDEFAEEDEGFLPAEVAGFGGDHGGDAFLGDADFGAAKDLAENDRGLHFAGEVGVVEFVAVADAFVRFEFEVGAAEGMGLAGVEVGEGHFVAAADLGVEVMDFAGESVWREPFGHGVGVEEGAVNALRRGAEDAVKFDGVGLVGCHNFNWFSWLRRTRAAQQDIYCAL
jgi:hypothetical protein